MLTDPIADMLTRIRNAQKAEHLKLTMPYSKLKLSVLEIMKKYNFIKEIGTESFENNKKDIKVTLKEKSNITLTRISKPGQRLYVKNKYIPRVKNTLGIQIISTPKGVLSSVEAKKQNLGGEVLCEVYEIN